jgi:hypothetical protein
MKLDFRPAIATLKKVFLTLPFRQTEFFLTAWPFVLQI